MGGKIYVVEIKDTILFIKDAHRNYAPDACPETSVRVCFGGKQSICFFERVLICWIFCKTNCNSEYRIRVRCIELYMVTWFKNMVDIVSNMFKKCPRSVIDFRTEQLGGYLWDLWSPYGL